MVAFAALVVVLDSRLVSRSKSAWTVGLRTVRLVLDVRIAACTMQALRLIEKMLRACAALPNQIPSHGYLLSGVWFLYMILCFRILSILGSS